jgi:bifunctional non-homologous end joining protein LigD
MGGKPSTNTGKPTFVIQEHHARALHWDFRLERNGVLVSWALPKGLPEFPSKNHLAVQTEDHPLDYADFAGDIPEGEYGGGRVILWDRGVYDTEKWSEREVMVVLHGQRSNGRYVLFRTGGKNWMIHRMDPPSEGTEPMPADISLMHPVSGSLPRADDGWAFEFLWDGIRALVHVDGGRVRAIAGNGRNLAPWFPELRQIGDFLGSRAVILDGSIAAFDEIGIPNFSHLQRRLNPRTPSRIGRLARDIPVTFLAFDLLYLDSRATSSMRYDKRRELLESLKLATREFACPPSVRGGDGNEIFRIARERGLLGVVAKRLESPYVPGSRSRDWIKIPVFRTQTLVVGGWTGDESIELGSLLVGIPGPRGLAFAGTVSSGFTEPDHLALRDELDPLSTDSSPFDTDLPDSAGTNPHFVRPELVIEVRYRSWSKDKKLREPSWRGIRPDIDPDQVARR